MSGLAAAGRGLRGAEPDPVRAIADVVLYEGYILWPYRKSALKNQRRWTFGGVYPRRYSERHQDDPWRMRTECLIEAREGVAVEVTVRFLQVVRRDVARLGVGGLEPVEELSLAGARHLAWDEARERELALPALRLGATRAGAGIEIEIEPGSEREPIQAEDGSEAGAVTRSWERLEGSLELAAEPLGPSLYRLAVEIRNTTAVGDGIPREEVLRRTFCSTHTVLRAAEGRFVSAIDPPPELAEAAEQCRSERTWPVLVGEPGERTTVLSSPIILEDYPRIAPESPGDLFDGGEIDQLLVLNILSLTDAEKAEMRDSDPRAREILERTEALSDEELIRLHGAIREFGMARR
jgi:hypothetical protein